MEWLGRGAALAGVISLSVAACMSPEPPRDAGGPGPDDATVVEVPVDVLISDDVTTFLDQPPCPAVDAGCAPSH